MQGIGQAMWEQFYVEPDSGQPLIGSLMDYGMPRADALPSFRTEIAEVLSPTNPLGIKAGGEGGTTAAPAMHRQRHRRCAARATASRDIKMPATPYKIWKTIQDAKARPDNVRGATCLARRHSKYGSRKRHASDAMCSSSARLRPPPLLAKPARAQERYPSRPVRLFVPATPGGVHDVIGRVWAEKIKRAFGTIVIDNRGGGGGTIAAAEVAHAQPDGYSLLLGSTTTHVLVPPTMANPPYDPAKDFATDLGDRHQLDVDRRASVGAGAVRLRS